MKIDKVKGQVNVYKLEMSYGQLVALRDALAKDHADALSDEVFMELNIFLELLPMPGEEKGPNGKIVSQVRPNDYNDVEPEGEDEEEPFRIEDIDLNAELPSAEDEEKPEANAKPKEEEA